VDSGFSGGGPGSDDNFLLGENWPAGNAADSIPYDGDMLEQSTGIIYPYATDPTDSEYGIELILEPGGAPQFVEPDQALLDAASVLPCPDGASDNAVVNLALVLCLPSAWTVESFEQTVDGVRTASVTLYAEPDLSSFPSGSSDGVVTTSLTILQQDGGWPRLGLSGPRCHGYAGRECNGLLLR